jgi:hypothetical protein
MQPNPLQSTGGYSSSSTSTACRVPLPCNQARGSLAGCGLAGAAAGSSTLSPRGATTKGHQAAACPHSSTAANKTHHTQPDSPLCVRTRQRDTQNCNSWHYCTTWQARSQASEQTSVQKQSPSDARALRPASYCTHRLKVQPSRSASAGPEPQPLADQAGSTRGMRGKPRNYSMYTAAAGGVPWRQLTARPLRLPMSPQPRRNADASLASRHRPQNRLSIPHPHPEHSSELPLPPSVICPNAARH